MAAIPHIYTQSPLEIGLNVTIDGPPAHHLLRVLRVNIGEYVDLFNGNGHHYRSEVTATHRQQLELRVLEQSPASANSPLKIHLLQGIARGEKMDWILQKAVELGVHEITPIHTERAHVRPKNLKTNKLEHWYKVMISATEQSGRNRLPTLNAPIQLKDLHIAAEHRWVLQPGLGNQWQQYRNQTLSELTLAIGPESGFSQSDLEILKDKGFEATGLGPRILRTETAPLAAISVAQALWGDLLG